MRHSGVMNFNKVICTCNIGVYQEIPSTGVDQWYQLEARSPRSNVQGRIRLKLWLSTREDRGTSEEDNWSELRQQELLYTVFLDYEINRHGVGYVYTSCACVYNSRIYANPATQYHLILQEGFAGELSQHALTILHQHALQGDLIELQQAVIRWVSTSRQPSIDARVLYRVLQVLILMKFFFFF